MVFLRLKALRSDVGVHVIVMNACVIIIDSVVKSS